MENQSIFNIQIDEESAYHLKETSKWARFLGVIGYIFTGLMLLLGLAMIFAMPDNPFMPGYLLGFVYFILAALYFYPIYTLHQFGKKMKQGLLNNDQGLFNESLKNFKNCLKFMGITTIILLGIYAVVLVVAMIMGIVNNAG